MQRVVNPFNGSERNNFPTLSPFPKRSSLVYDDSDYSSSEEDSEDGTDVPSTKKGLDWSIDTIATLRPTNISVESGM